MLICFKLPRIDHGLDRASGNTKGHNNLFQKKAALFAHIACRINNDFETIDRTPFCQVHPLRIDKAFRRDAGYLISGSELFTELNISMPRFAPTEKLLPSL